MIRRNLLKASALGALTLAAAAWMPQALAADTIKVGILHSLSGTMAIPETSLKDVALMTIDDGYDPTRIVGSARSVRT